MFDQRQLATFDAFAHGQRIIAGCAVRNESSARHAAVTARRFTLVAVALIAVPLAILALAQVGILWIGAIFVIVPAGAFAIRTVSGLSAKPKAFDAIITEHSLLLIDLGSQGAGPAVAHAYPRLALADVRSMDGKLAMTSAGNPIKLLADPADANEMATLLQAPPPR
jgi:hypothetical protein